MKIVVLASGGLDSAVMVHAMLRAGDEPQLLSIDYGQRHVKELDAAHALGNKLGLPWHCVDLGASGLPALLGGSALTDPTIAVPDGHYAAESMRITVVPNRNAIMLALAFGMASANQADAVAIAAHGGDHFIYPDCRPAFITAFAAMEYAALAEGPSVELLAPFLDFTKADIVKLGAEIGVAFAETWSCYKGGALHCGSCGTCVERREAFQVADVADPTKYASANTPGR